MMIIHAAIHTMTGRIIEKGWVQAENGKITGIGDMSDCVTYSGEVFDAKGMTLLPGFIDAHTHLGMWEDSLGFEGDDGNEDTDPSLPHMRAIDAVNPRDKCFMEAARAGITTVVTGPGSSNPIGGQIIAMKTVGQRIDDMILKSPMAVKFALGENPKTVYHGKNQAPVTRMATAAIIREQLLKASRYLIDTDIADNDMSEMPDYDIKNEALLPLLTGKISAHFHAHRADDIFTALRIAAEFSIDPVIIHATEAHEIADILANEKVPLLCGPLICDRSKPELKLLTPKSPSILSQKGLEIAIITDHPVVPVQYLPLCAGLAVREGMDYDAALRAITINPARICGIDKRVGSIESGKDADFALFDEDPLSLKGVPKAVFCGGKQVV